MSFKLNSCLKKWLVKLIGVGIFIIILIKIDISTVSVILTKVDPQYLILTIILTPFVFAIKSWRWKFLLKLQGIEYSLTNSFRAFIASSYIGIITPGRLGELLKVYYLKRDKEISLGKAFSSVIIDRMFDITVIMTLGIIGLAIYSDLLAPGSVIIFLIVLLTFSIVIFLFLNKKYGLRISKWLFKYFTNSKYSINEFYDGIHDLKKINIIYAFIISGIAYLFIFIQAYIIALALNISIEFYFLTFCICIVNLITIIPISISGIGTRDAVLITLFAGIGYNAEVAVGYSILLLFIAIISKSTIGAVVWFTQPIDLKVRSTINQKDNQMQIKPK